MKVVIIGGGIAGLTMGILLQKKEYDVVVCERSEAMPRSGHAFLMHDDGLSILKELNCCSTSMLRNKQIDAFTLKRPDGNDVRTLPLHGWRCLKRVDLISYLYDLLPAEKIKEGREFSHFLARDGKPVAAVFLNGDVEYGDLFIGADGGNSRVRDYVYGKVEFTPVTVKEIVGVSNRKRIAKRPSSEFVKYQSKHNGLAFGMIPAQGTEHVWFMQYDPAIADVTGNSPESIKEFCKKMLADFPSQVHSLIDDNDFSTTYVWNTRDFDLLPSFHKQNVVLIGDAAHLALPFTSAGTTNAIVDAKTLVQSLEQTADYDEAFTKYYHARAEDIKNHIELGRELKKLFLAPNLNDEEMPLPLISSKRTPNKPSGKKPIQILYFTDPICSTCWIIQPLLRKLKLEYDDYINIEYRMGGLLPSWEGYDKGIIKKPEDAAKHWEEVSISHEMPLDGDVWLEDPLTSSYPPSIAFKAAQIQDGEKAVLFLRRIKEMVFLEKKNIIKWAYLEKAAKDTGLDAARLLEDINGRGLELFKEDLAMAKELGVRVFPTLFFSDGTGTRFMLKGFQPYDKIEDMLNQVMPGIRKKPIDTAPKSLFRHFPKMTEKEFAFLSNVSKDNAHRTLTELYDRGAIDKYESKNGTIWISHQVA